MNKKVTVVYSDEALKQLQKLPDTVSRRIVCKVSENANQPNVLGRARSLKGKLAGRFRYRIGEYRVIFSIDENGALVLLTILTVKHRKDIYK